MKDALATTVPSKEREILAAREKEARDILEGFKSFEIEDDDDYEVAAEAVKEVKRIFKDIEGRRKKITAPLNEALKEFRAWYQPALTVLTNTEAYLKGKMGTYTTLQKEKAVKAMQLTAAASKAGDFDAAHEASKGIVEAPTAQGITVTYYYDYIIQDLSQVPERFKALDHSGVKIYLKGFGKEEPTPVPGLEFVRKERVIART